MIGKAARTIDKLFESIRLQIGKSLCPDTTFVAGIKDTIFNIILQIFLFCKVIDTYKLLAHPKDLRITFFEGAKDVPSGPNAHVNVCLPRSTEHWNEAE